MRLLSAAIKYFSSFFLRLSNCLGLSRRKVYGQKSINISISLPLDFSHLLRPFITGKTHKIPDKNTASHPRLRIPRPSLPRSSPVDRHKPPWRFIEGVANPMLSAVEGAILTSWWTSGWSRLDAGQWVERKIQAADKDLWDITARRLGWDKIQGSWVQILLLVLYRGVVQTFCFEATLEWWYLLEQKRMNVLIGNTFLNALNI